MLMKKIKNKIVAKIQPQIDNYVKEHDNWLVDKICQRIEYLALNTDYDLEQVLNDIKNGGYLDNDEKKCS